VPAALRCFAWWSFLVTEISLVAAAAAYVGVGTRDFWLVAAAAAAASIAYVVAVRTTPAPTLGDTTSVTQRWYWF
jgi:hypothetical protein